MANTGADLVVRVAANIDSLKTEMVAAAASIKTIEETTTRASKASEAWTGVLDELGKSFGVRVAEGMLLRDVIRHVIDFGQEVLASGDAIQKMADQTSLTTDEVQRFMYIAGQSGTSVEALVGAVQNLQQRLGDDKTGAAGALRDLNINLEAFKSLDPYEQMVSLSEAIRGVEDPTERASLEAALFGKTWKEVGPAILSEMRQVGDAAPVMADGTVKALDRIGDAQKRAHQQAVAWGGGVVLAIEEMGFALYDYLSMYDPAHFGVATSTLLAHEVELNDPDGLKGALASIKPPILAIGEAFSVMAMSEDEVRAADKELTESARALMKVNQDMADAMAHLNAVGDDWHQTLDRIDGTVVEAIKYYLAAGVSQTALATAYGLTAEEIHAVADARKEDLEAAKAEDAILAAFEQDRIERARSITEGIHAETEALDENVKSVHALAGEWLTVAEAKKKALAGGSKTYDLTKEEDRNRLEEDDPMVVGFLHDGYSLAQAYQLQLGRQWNFQVNIPHKGPRVPGYASGVQDAPGGWATIGERGPETMFVPPHASIYPTGSGAGATTVNIFITQPLGTPTEIARVVGQALDTRMRQLGVRSPSGA